MKELDYNNNQAKRMSFKIWQKRANLEWCNRRERERERGREGGFSTYDQGSKKLILAFVVFDTRTLCFCGITR